MKHAYLIIAHHQPEQLARLLARLASPEVGCFVHVDRKADLEAFRGAAPTETPTVWLQDRVAVRWGDISQVDATLRLLRAAHAALPSCARFTLLSGADYPLRSTLQREAQLQQPGEYLRIARKLEREGSQLHWNYVARWWFNWLPACRWRQFWLGKLPRRPWSKVTFYHGSNWWSLTRPVVDWILTERELGPRLHRFLRFSRCPDEIYFHTLLMASPFAEAIAAAETERTEEHVQGLHFIDWTPRGGTLPNVVQMEDLDRLRASSAQFARKVDPIKSAALLEALDAQIG